MNIEQILQKVETLPPMPAIAVQLLEAAQDPDVNLGTVAQLLEHDPAMTANLLRACNSPFYGLRREVTSVRQATSLLGLKQVVQIAITMLTSRYLAPSQDGYALGAGDLWRSSVAAAIAAEMLARDVGYTNPSTAYTAGLLQDMGKIVLADFLGDLLPQVQHRVEAEQLSWEEAERQVVGVPHPEVGAAVLERWGFPAALVESVRYHHRPTQAVLDPQLAHISHVADAFTMTLGMGIGADGLAYALDGDSIRRFRLDEAGRVDRLLAQLSTHLRQAEDLLRPPGEQP